jgi:hypothetical protein
MSGPTSRTFRRANTLSRDAGATGGECVRENLLHGRATRRWDDAIQSEIDHHLAIDVLRMRDGEVDYSRSGRRTEESRPIDALQQALIALLLERGDPKSYESPNAFRTSAFAAAV